MTKALMPRELARAVGIHQGHRGGYDHHGTTWNDLTHFVAMATFTSDDREAYDKGADT